MIKVHLSRLMGERKLNIAEVSRKTGLHRNGITKLYYEETDGIKFDTLEKLCKALECEITDLIEIIEDDSKES
ncbi:MULTISPECIES: helix-turn-helix domain-containing protein [Bacillus amyloliquefaciens group]|uniref:XRE family transcriptional regulator n=1 Tax=Bacillus velezensis TaxID=492670 RepID=A0ABC8D7X0_BACVE|nr:MULTISPECIES: helix-turn-helix transcriptional regulator [Bacillus amyloliquefaciens group]AUG35581.1 XRE family transcriptional regulator [Bacillus velezensis]AVI28278.1 XRE family transcriptional regulator [Bacillus velezensis]AWX71931.1 XRE family transcriptional regulator [Bacillus velezensis]MBE7960245.1 helix-turn-helix transcriptional regulator [Bacillus amyloliquefaciens]MBW7976600.1 XRE family transcriptional regulator [Bacillus velezensis]